MTSPRLQTLLGAFSIDSSRNDLYAIIEFDDGMAFRFVSIFNNL